MAVSWRRLAASMSTSATGLGWDAASNGRRIQRLAYHLPLFGAAANSAAHYTLAKLVESYPLQPRLQWLLSLARSW